MLLHNNNHAKLSTDTITSMMFQPENETVQTQVSTFSTYPSSSSVLASSILEAEKQSKPRHQKYLNKSKQPTTSVKYSVVVEIPPCNRYELKPKKILICSDSHDRDLAWNINIGLQQKLTKQKQLVLLNPVDELMKY
uniref:Uncharacterized protein n=1 Tax=Graphocephala atropunctata TaxID=36148 RepID=A0A1B6L8H6_9HEMI